MYVCVSMWECERQGVQQTVFQKICMQSEKYTAEQNSGSAEFVDCAAHTENQKASGLGHFRPTIVTGWYGSLQHSHSL